MGSVRRNAPGSSSYLVRFSLAAFLGVAGSGCASLGSFRNADYPLLGGFWESDKHSTDSVPGYDSYAQQVHEGQARAAARQAKIEQGGSDGGDSGQDRAPASKPSNGNDSSKQNLQPKLSTTRSRNDQDTIRVTLGRPESLPAISAPELGGTPPTSIASSTKSGWKKESASRARPEDEEREPRSVRPLLDEPIVQHTAPDPEEPLRTDKEELLARNVSHESPELEREPRSVRPLLDEPIARHIPREPERLANSTKPAKLAKSNEVKLEEILGRAKKRLDSIDSYRVSMTRVERVNGRLQAEENVILSVRRSPMAVRLQWEDGPSKGREVIYSTSLDDRTIHVNMAKAAIPLPRMSIAVDSPLIMKNSRHSIKEAGFDTILARMSKQVVSDDPTGSSGGKVSYKGLITREGSDRPAHCFVRVAPNGEKWEVLLDPKTLLPTSVVAHDAAGELLERYTYRDLKENPTELAAADAFDPDALWGKQKGLFSRLAGVAAGGAAGATTPDSSTTR